MRRPIDSAPLPLTSKRWLTLRAHFGNAGQDGEEVPAVTTLIRRWSRAVGTYAEEYEYAPLRESYLHQETILDVAYAVVPHITPELERLDPDRRIEVLNNLAIVEATRRTPRSRVEAMVRELASVHDDLRSLFIQNARDRHPTLPEDLADAYLAAISDAKKSAGAAWGKRRSKRSTPSDWRRHVGYLREQGLTDDDIVLGVRTLTEKDSSGSALVYRAGAETMLAALRAAAVSSQGFSRRLPRGAKSGRLVVQALGTLAWMVPRTPLSRMLACQYDDSLQ